MAAHGARATMARGSTGNAMKGITEWLASIGLSEYAQRFADNGTDLSVLRDLTDHTRGSYMSFASRGGRASVKASYPAGVVALAVNATKRAKMIPNGGSKPGEMTLNERARSPTARTFTST